MCDLAYHRRYPPDFLALHKPCVFTPLAQPPSAPHYPRAVPTPSYHGGRRYCGISDPQPYTSPTTGGRLVSTGTVTWTVRLVGWRDHDLAPAGLTAVLRSRPHDAHHGPRRIGPGDGDGHVDRLVVDQTVTAQLSLDVGGAQPLVADRGDDEAQPHREHGQRDDHAASLPQGDSAGGRSGPRDGCSTCRLRLCSGGSGDA